MRRVYPRTPLDIQKYVIKKQGELIMKKLNTKQIVIYGMVAAIYVVVTVMLSSLSYMGVQFRIAEMLTLLCFYKKEYIVPLTLGCFIANLFSPMMAWDVPLGTLATLISLFLITRCKNIYVASLMPVIVNAIIVGIELKLALNLPLFLSMGQVAIGEFVCVSILGVAVFKLLEKNNKFMDLIKFNK